MAKFHVPKHIAVSIISHGSGKSKLDATYDLYEYFYEKADALDKWGEWVTEKTFERERYLHSIADVSAPHSICGFAVTLNSSI